MGTGVVKSWDRPDTNRPFAYPSAENPPFAGAKRPFPSAHGIPIAGSSAPFIGRNRRSHTFSKPQALRLPAYAAFAANYPLQGNPLSPIEPADHLLPN